MDGVNEQAQLSIVHLILCAVIQKAGGSVEVTQQELQEALDLIGTSQKTENSMILTVIKRPPITSVDEI